MKFQFAAQGLKELMVALIIVDEDCREGAMYGLVVGNVVSIIFLYLFNTKRK
jgi:hypothetical protein